MFNPLITTYKYFVTVRTENLPWPLAGTYRKTNKSVFQTHPLHIQTLPDIPQTYIPKTPSQEAFGCLGHGQLETFLLFLLVSFDIPTHPNDILVTEVWFLWLGRGQNSLTWNVRNCMSWHIPIWIRNPEKTKHLEFLFFCLGMESPVTTSEFLFVGQ